MDPQYSASDFFGSMIDSYDSLIHRAVPRYEEMTSRLLDYLPNDAPRILELGAGTGNLTTRLADRYPKARITNVDASEDMLKVTRRRLGERAANVEFVSSLFETLDFPPSSFDLIATCISLHHVADKRALYQRLRGWLAPGGRFAMADQFRGGMPEIHDFNWRAWLDFCRLPGHCTDLEIQDLLTHAEAHDHYTPVRTHFALLVEAGFDPDTIDCVWRSLIWGIIIADAPK